MHYAWDAIFIFCTPLCAFSNRDGIACPHAKRTLAAQKKPNKTTQKPNKKESAHLFRGKQKNHPPLSLKLFWLGLLRAAKQQEQSSCSHLHSAVEQTGSELLCSAGHKEPAPAASTVQHHQTHQRGHVPSPRRRIALHPSWYLHTHIYACALAFSSPFLLLETIKSVLATPVHVFCATTASWARHGVKPQRALSPRLWASMTL